MMITRRYARLVISLLALLPMLLHSAAAGGQAQCGEVQEINFPVDTALFRLVQDYGAANPRYQGRYHTGEDWYGGRGSSLGQPVHAVANGRVTYSSTTGWGRDGGVVIIEHTFPDGSVAYSEYGHMMETDEAHFPAVLTCVRMGDVVGAIADVRPAPHVHFEIKTNNPALPGNGYTALNPLDGGWRRPTKFIVNWQTWLATGYRWYLDVSDEHGPISPPVELDDHSLIFLDSDRVGRVTPDGRSLWRIVLDRSAVGVTAYEDSAVLVYADGTMTVVTRDGAFGENWSLNTAFDGPPMAFGDVLVIHTPGNALAAIDMAQRAVRWTVGDVQPVVRWQATSALMGLVTADAELVTLSAAGERLDSAHLRDGAAMAVGPGGNLLAYTRGGLWLISRNGQWSSPMEGAPSGSTSGALAATEDGRLFLFDGTRLYAYGVGNVPLWQTELPGVTGLTSLDSYGNVVLLTSNHGQIIPVQAATGAVCSTARIYGDERAQAWHSLGDDGILRLAVADQILGLNWERFIGACG
jgi:hypothetical protein